jgi:hypothetical protein
MNQGLAVAIGAMLIAAAIALSHRYEIAPIMLAPDYVAAWRVDNWTGEILYCDKGNVAGVGCSPVWIRKQK